MEEIKLHDMASVLGSNLGLNQKSIRAFTDSFSAVLMSSLLGSSKVVVPHLGVFTATRDDDPVNPSERLDVSDDLAKRLSYQAYHVRDILSALAGFIREELLNGKRFIVNEIGSFELRSGEPRTQPEKGNSSAPQRSSGQRAYPPSDTFMLFQPESLLLKNGNFRELSFAMAEEFKEGLDRTPLCFIHLIVPQTDFFVGTLTYHFSQAGWTVDVSTSVANARMKIESERSYLVVLDTSVDGAWAFLEMLKLDRRTNKIPVIAVYDSEGTFESPSAMTVMGDAAAYQPFDLRQILAMANMQILAARRPDRMERYTAQIQLPTDQDHVAGCAGLLTRLLSESGMTEENQVTFMAAVREALSNAVRHGNQSDRSKKILVQYIQDDEKVLISIKDRGKGFDFLRHLKTADGAQGSIATLRRNDGTDRKGGLGITLMRKCSDLLEFHAPGNGVTMMKYLKPRRHETTEIELVV